MAKSKRSGNELQVTSATPRAWIEAVPVFCAFDELRDISTMKPNPKNPNRHPDNQIQLLAHVILYQGFRAPITVSKRSGLIVRGHCRLEAARSLHLPSVPVDVQDYATEAEEYADLIADNRLAELADMDYTVLAELLQNMGDEQLELTGYTGKDLEAMLQEIASAEPVSITEDDDEAEDPPETPFSKCGDIWELGPHRLMCGDSTKQADVDRLMNGRKVRIVFTDPPWNVDYGASEHHPSWKHRQIINDSMPQEEFASFLSAAFSGVKLNAEPGCMVYVVMSAQEWGTLMNVLQALDYHWSSTIIWHKDSLVLSRKDYHTQYEPIWYGWIGGSRLCPLIDRTQSDVWDIPRPKKSDEHPTMKPIELVVKAIQNSSKAGDTVADFFGGSGTTLIAAEKCKRICYMMELDARYVDVDIRRYEKLAGSGSIVCVRDGQRLSLEQVRGG